MSTYPVWMASLRGPGIRLSISTALTASIVLLTALVGVLSAWQLSDWGREEIHGRELRRRAVTAQRLAEQITVALKERQADVRDLRDLLEGELAQAPEDLSRKLLERTQDAQPAFSWLGIAGADGQIVLATGRLLEGRSVQGRAWFDQAQHREVFFGDLHPAVMLEPHLRNPDGAPLRLLDIAMPLRDPQDRVRGVLGAHLNWRLVQDLVQRALDEPDPATPMHAAIVAADGELLYDTEGATGKVEALLTAWSNDRMQAIRWHGDAEPTLLATSAMPWPSSGAGLHWRIVLRQPVSAVEAGVTAMRWRVAGSTLVVGLVFSLLGLLAVRRVTRPLQALVGEIRSFGDTGRPPARRPPPASEEVYRLQASFLGMAAKVATHKQQLQDTQVEIIRALGRAGEFRDNETGNHVLRMSLCAARLAELAGLDPQAVHLIGLASQVHDIGKIGIPDGILLKPGRLNPEERACMEQHVEIGARILGSIDTPLTTQARSIALSHHEKWDGSGYPDGLTGEAIPLAARIVAICDVFDALRSPRPYKPAWTQADTIVYLRGQSGRHFDPALLALFLDHVEDFLALRARHLDDPSDDGLLPTPGADAAAPATKTGSRRAEAR